MPHPEKFSDRPSNGVLQPSENSDAARNGSPAGGVQIGVRRDGCLVQISLTSGSEYSSIELYDHLVQSIKKGALRLDIGLRGGTV